jgi:hypothetical protein
LAGVGNCPRHFFRRPLVENLELEFRRDGKIGYKLRRQNNAAPMLKYAEQGREKEEYFGLRKDTNYYRVSAVDWNVVQKIKAEHGVDGLNLRTPQETRKYLQILQRDYPRFLTTNKKVYRAPTKSSGPRGRPKFASIPAECLK